MYSTGISTFDFIVYIVVMVLVFMIKIYRDRNKEQKKKIEKLESDNLKLKEAVEFYHENTNDKTG